MPDVRKGLLGPRAIWFLDIARAVAARERCMRPPPGGVQHARATDLTDHGVAGTAGSPPAPSAAGNVARASPFERFSPADVTDLIAGYPLAWVCPDQLRAEQPSLLPLLAETDAEGNLVALIGHMARRNPLVPILTADPGAVLLFTGPQAYISTALVSEPTWAPTWNYAQLRIAATVRFEPDKGGEALQKLLNAPGHEADTGWTTAMMGARYAPMEQAIIAFRAEVVRLEGRFKLGQDERPETLREIIAAHPSADLVRWMSRFNAARL